MSHRLRLSLLFVSLVWAGLVLFSFQRAWDNPRLLATVDRTAPLTLLPEAYEGDHYVSGPLKENGEHARARATSGELRAIEEHFTLTVYRTGDTDRPFITRGQIERMLPFYDFGVVTLSWRVFLGLGMIALYAALAVLRSRFSLMRECLDEAALLLAPTIAALLAGVGALRLIAATLG